MAHVDRRAEAVAELQARLGWTFRDPTLLEQALTHGSVGDRTPGAANNERLEFLGDRVLGLVIAERLYDDSPSAPEGELAIRLNALVSRTACARVARRAGFGPALRLGGSESNAGGRDKDVILADACEAVLAAVYRDGGLEAARAAIEALWGEDISDFDPARMKDVKTRLQEWAHARGCSPVYEVTGRAGPQHASRFIVEVRVAGVAPAIGEASSRQGAEKAAAAAMLEREGLG